MRSVIRLELGSLLVFAALSGCGNLSNDDLQFIAAIPHAQNLHVSVPAQSSSQALQVRSACPLGRADSWVASQATGEKINSGVDGIIALVEVIRGVAPTTRPDPTTRTWGPWLDSKHPGVSYQVIMTRNDNADATPYSFEYTFNGQLSGGLWLPILTGTFFGAQAVSGAGFITIHFDNALALGTSQSTDPKVPVYFSYDLMGNPHTIAAHTPEFQANPFNYGFAGYEDGHGRFDYSFDSPNNFAHYFVQAWFTKAGAGKGEIDVNTFFGSAGQITECWDANACLGYINDPNNLLKLCLAGIAPCTQGDAASCPLF